VDDAMAISLPDTRQLFGDDLQALRLRALRGCEQGFTEVEIAVTKPVKLRVSEPES
jgi:hypothetical protein